MKINNIDFNCTIEDVISKLRKELELRGSRLLSKTKKISGYLMVQCPYHKNGNERTPSAQFKDDNGLFYCFGCKETHSLPDVISYCLKENGWNWLRNNFLGTVVTEREIGIEFSRDKKETAKNTTYIDKKELDKYRFIHPYIINRKVDPKIVKLFDVGYDKENDCITFPNKDINGNILFIATRSVKGKTFRYPKNIEKPVYGLYEIERAKKAGKKINEIYVTESMIDTLNIWSWGKYAVALNGTGSSSQLKELSKYDCRVYILATDNDSAGRDSRLKIKFNLNNKILKELDYKSYGNCKDINDMTKEQFLKANITM